MDRLQLLREETHVRLRAGNRGRRRCTARPDRDQREGGNQEQPGQRDHAASSSSRTQSDQREEVLRAFDAEAEQEVVEEVVVRARVRRLDLPVLLQLRGHLLAEPLDVLGEHVRRHEAADEETQVEGLCRLGLGG